MNMHTGVNNPTLQRIYSEFLEMPGLRLTCQQAQRLWGLDKGTCADLLEYLVEVKFLYCSGHGVYMRLTDGRHASLEFRIPGASTEEDIARSNRA